MSQVALCHSVWNTNIPSRCLPAVVLFYHANLNLTGDFRPRVVLVWLRSGAQLVNCLPAAQQTNSLTDGVVGKTWVCGMVGSIFTASHDKH